MKNTVMKKALCLLLALSLLLVFGLFAVASGEDESTDQGKGSASGNTSSALGKYSVEISSCRLAEDYEGKPIVIVTYRFTNNADDPISFTVALEANAYQDGIGLNECYFVAENANYSSDNQMKEIKTGATLEVEVAYELNDSTTDVEIEVSELFSFSDKKITKTFSIAGN